MWSLRKIALSGIFAALLLVAEVGLALPFVMAFGPGMGSIVGVFIGPLLFVLFREILNEKGALILIGFIASVLFVPLPAFGPAGFLPKLVILSTAGIFTEIVFLAMSKSSGLARGIASGVAFDFVGILIFIKILEYFKVPGSERFTSMFAVFLVVSIIGGAIGGAIGAKIFEKIEKRPAIQRIRNS
jgi:hypothetical protein